MDSTKKTEGAIDIKHLSRLARISLTDEEIQALQSELTSILDHVAEIQTAPVDLERAPEKEVLRNVLRSDGEAYEPSTFKDALLAEVPESQDGYVKVKKIL